VATEVWRTGAFPAIPAGATGPRKAYPAAATSYDIFGGQPGQTSRQQASYRRRQQAGIDALIAMATPVVQPDDRSEESRDDNDEPLITNRNIRGS
jgi:hypothetical protein